MQFLFSKKWYIFPIEICIYYRKVDKQKRKTFLTWLYLYHNTFGSLSNYILVYNSYFVAYDIQLLSKTVLKLSDHELSLEKNFYTHIFISSFYWLLLILACEDKFTAVCAIHWHINYLMYHFCCHLKLSWWMSHINFTTRYRSIWITNINIYSYMTVSQVICRPWKAWSSFKIQCVYFCQHEAQCTKRQKKVMLKWQI